MRQRVELHGVLRPIEPHLDPIPFDGDALGQAHQLRAERLDGQLHADPGQPRLPELADQVLPTFLLDTERRRGTHASPLRALREAVLERNREGRTA